MSAVPYVAVEPGVRLYVDDSGGVGRPVVFLHGWPLDSRQWEYQIAALQPQGLRCVAIDSRGFGRSDRAWGHYSYDVLADDLWHVLDALELADAALVGLSLGAGTALRYMTRHGGSGVTQLALCGTPGGWDVSPLIDLERHALLRAVGAMLFSESDEGAELTLQWFYEMGLAGMPYATRRCLELLRDADLHADAQALAVPALILQGPDDRLAPYALGEALARAIPGARLVVLAHGGHGAFFTERAAFNGELSRFLSTPGRGDRDRP